MADINPTITAASTTGRQFQNVRWDSKPTVPSGARSISTSRLALWSGYFSTVSDSLSYAPIRGPVACAWQANQAAAADAAGVRVDASGFITLSCGAVTPSGWIHVLTAGSQSASTQSSTMTPIPSGDPAHTPKGVIRLNHKSAAPDTYSSGVSAPTANLAFKVIPFVLTSASDRWKCTTGTRGTDRLLPGVVAVAWQSNSPASVAADQCAVTLDAAGDVVFTGGANGGAGWLWVWQNRT